MSNEETKEVLASMNWAELPVILERSENALQRAMAACDKLPEIENDELDNVYKEMIDKIKRTSDGFKEERTPFTRKFTEVTKGFTAQEGLFGQMVEKLQVKRNAYTKYKLDEQRKANALRDAKIEKEKEVVTIKMSVQNYLANMVMTFVQGAQAYCNQQLDTVTKENIVEMKKLLSNDPQWKPAQQKIFEKDPEIYAKHHDKAYIRSVMNSLLEETKNDFFTKTKEIMKSTSENLDVALTNKKEAKQLQDQQAKETEEQAAVEISQNILSAQIEATFVQVDNAPVMGEQVKAKVAQKIVIHDNKAWMKFINFYFSHSPEATDPTKDLSKKTFLQCKTFCEKAASSSDTYLTADETFSYEEDVKAK
jgi:hypothetical protein